MELKKVIVIVGTTSSGKTALAVAVARSIGGEVLSADSRQVYRGLDLGSGKVTKEEMQGVPHHMLDVADPGETYTAADFARAGTVALQNIVSRGAIPIIAGGTGFYIDVLLGRVSPANVPPDVKLREALEAKDTDALGALLEAADPERATTVDRANRRRLIRALEIALTHTEDRPLYGNVTEDRPLYQVLWIGLAVEKEELKKKIGERLDARFASGMLEEAQKLHEGGLSYERMEELGLEYRHMARHLAGVLSYDEMVRELLKEIRQYAKRQTTWFKKNKNILWFSPNEREKILEAIGAFIQK